jgi:hypothetical protein
VNPNALELWAAVQAARDLEARAALEWAEAVGPGHDEAAAWERARRAERVAFEAFARAVDVEAGPGLLAA